MSLLPALPASSCCTCCCACCTVPACVSAPALPLAVSDLEYGPSPSLHFTKSTVPRSASCLPLLAGARWAACTLSCTPCHLAHAQHLAQVRAAHHDLRDLCSLMGGQMGRFRSLLEYAGKSAEDLKDRVRG